MIAAHSTASHDTIHIREAAARTRRVKRGRRCVLAASRKGSPARAARDAAQASAAGRCCVAAAQQSQPWAPAHAEAAPGPAKAVCGVSSGIWCCPRRGTHCWNRGPKATRAPSAPSRQAGSLASVGAIVAPGSAAVAGPICRASSSTLIRATAKTAGREAARLPFRRASLAGAGGSRVRNSGKTRKPAVQLKRMVHARKEAAIQVGAFDPGRKLSNKNQLSKPRGPRAPGGRAPGGSGSA